MGIKNQMEKQNLKCKLGSCRGYVRGFWSPSNQTPTAFCSPYAVPYTISMGTRVSPCFVPSSIPGVPCEQFEDPTTGTKRLDDKVLGCILLSVFQVQVPRRYTKKACVSKTCAISPPSFFPYLDP